MSDRKKHAVNHLTKLKQKTKENKTMETTKQKDKAKKSEFKTEVICDVTKNDNEVYRIAYKQYREASYVDLRLFFRDKDDRSRLVPTFKGIWVEEPMRRELIRALIDARKAPAVGCPEGKKVESQVVCEIPISGDEIYRVSKGSGKKSSFVDIRRFFRREGEFIPYKRKGVSIQESVLDDVITGLMKAEFSCKAR